MDVKMFDNVKYEKEKAIERFNSFQRMKKIFKVLEIAFVLLLLSWSTRKIPSAVGFQGKISELSVYVSNTHFVFFIGNAIILALFFLCRAGNSSGDGDHYKEYSRTERATPVYEVPVASSVAEDNVVLEKKERKLVAVEEVEVAIAVAEKEIMRFQRTFSEKLKTEIAVRPRKELRRSETEIDRSGLSRGGGGGRRTVRSPCKTVEHLTNEEFKLAIDAFIDKHRGFSKKPIIKELSK